MTSPEIQSRIKHLREELDKAIKHYNSRARAAYWIAHLLMFMTLGASSAASLCGFLGESGKLTGALASLSTVTAVIALTFKPAGRANWHYKKKDGLFELRRRLLYEMPEQPSADNIASISKAWTDLASRMNDVWEKEFTLSWTGSPTHKSHPNSG